MESKYQVLTIPTKKVLTFDHIYYKEYAKDDTKELVEIPEKRALYAIRFDQPFTAEYVKKYFGLAGKIKTAHMGEYKHKSNNKKKRRQLWFVIVIYKKSSEWENAMNAKWLQNEIYKNYGDGKGKWRITFNPEENEEKINENLTEEQKKQQDKIKEMEEEGFTVMMPAGSKRYVSGGDASMKVISKGMIEKMMGKKKKKTEENEEFEFYESTKDRKRRLKEGEKGFYMYETKEQKKKELDELRKGLEEDMKKIKEKEKLNIIN